MGRMICSTHGRVGFVEPCSHVADQIKTRRRPEGHRLTILGNLFLCDACFNRLGFQRFASLSGLPWQEVISASRDNLMEAFLDAYETIEDRSAFCLKCVADLERETSSV